MMKKFVTLFKKPVVYVSSLLTLFLASLIIILALFMGQEAGNFVIEIEAGDVSKNLHITETLSDENYYSRLQAGSFEGMSHSTYGRFQNRLETYKDAEGVYIDKERHVYAYTFYILNNNEESLDLQATMYYSNVTNALDTAIRVMTITEDLGIRCYQAPDEIPTDYGADYPEIFYFESKDIVYEETYLTFEPGTYIKYTVMFWLEGNDIDCNDDRRLGTIRFSLKLSIL